jgi:anti-sigma B factor antagonist
VEELSVTTSEPGAECQPHVAGESTEIPFDDVFTVSARKGENGTVTLVLVGELDTFTAPQLRSSIAGQLAGQPRELVLDLSAVDFLGSAGLGTLVETQHLARDRNIALRLVASSRAVLRPLQVTGLIELFTITNTSTYSG